MRPGEPTRAPDLVEDAVARLHEAIAILDAIDDADMLGELPAEPAARRNHQRAVSLLTILRRELAGVRRDLQAAGQIEDALAAIRVREDPPA
ncbi:MAG TPA: hypothetical protein VFE18_11165 [Phenylobacterium sp.]|jgi:hypothetical protein|uniref:hypothetical protein n=1 Tax=Phenylobacterium sp. TaxID=1871053 RepID=UPI002D34B67C|nr:hypothetical protein [Phenylobacterium sp.]HZZ68721.1 hypothetical protein [Phenylobacterium sp.]